MQKVVVAREFSFDTPILIISQPTRGVDIGAMEFIHQQIMDKRNQGCAILLVSADLDEVLRLSDRVITLYEGKITKEFKAGDMDKMELSYYMTGNRGKDRATPRREGSEAPQQEGSEMPQQEGCETCPEESQEGGGDHA
jgi:simple sugar transport system ATP-binding protein